MVQVSKVLNGIGVRAFQRKRFLDSLHIYVRGGAGGNGFPKYGGVGGKGGDVYVVAADTTLKRLQQQHPSKRVFGGQGENSKTYKILGGPGRDVIIKAPVGVTIVNDNNRILGDLNALGDQILIAKGGAGGSKFSQYCGLKGQNQNITLDLKLIADVGFVGFPNAGKSTLLKALSRASPKIANYPFTTIEPNIGIMEFGDLRQISLADLPGLIEGAHLNFGMGHKFLKHVVRTKMLLFVVDIGGFQLNPHSPNRTAFETVVLLNRELELYRDDLLLKPAMLVVTKSDLEGANEQLEILLEQLKNIDALKEEFPEEIRPEKTVEFDEIVPVCSTTAHNIELLKSRIRFYLDYHADDERHKEVQRALVEVKDDQNLPFKILV